MSYPWLVHSRPERPQKALTYSAQRGRIYGHARLQIWSEEISIQERRMVNSSVLDFSCPLDQDEWIAPMRGELQKKEAGTGLLLQFVSNPPLFAVLRDEQREQMLGQRAGTLFASDRKPVLPSVCLCEHPGVEMIAMMGLREAK